jgi:hypothetical protein
MLANKENHHPPIEQNAFLPDILKIYNKEYFSRLYSFIKSQTKWDTTGDSFRSIYLTDIADRLNLLTTRQLNDLISILQKHMYHD